LLEGGAAQNGRSDGGLNEFASVAHGCLLFGVVGKRGRKFFE
jgi:hypothetical protein